MAWSARWTKAAGRWGAGAIGALEMTEVSGDGAGGDGAGRPETTERQRCAVRSMERRSGAVRLTGAEAWRRGRAHDGGRPGRWRPVATEARGKGARRDGSRGWCRQAGRRRRGQVPAEVPGAVTELVRVGGEGARCRDNGAGLGRRAKEPIAALGAVATREEDDGARGEWRRCRRWREWRRGQGRRIDEGRRWRIDEGGESTCGKWLSVGKEEARSAP